MVAFSPDTNATFILSSSKDKTIKLWERSSANRLNSMIFSPDESLIVRCFSDKSTKLWEKSSGNLLKIFESIQDNDNSVYFSTDGKMIISSKSGVRILYKSSENNKLKEHYLISFDGLSLSDNYNFFCKYTISQFETGLFCKNMIFDNSIVSSKNENIFQKFGGIFLKDFTF